MNDEERKIVEKVIKEMKNAHIIIDFWLRGNPIEKTLASWIKELEQLIS